MPDEPLDALRLDTTAESPRPEFARALRERLVAELSPPPHEGAPTITTHQPDARLRHITPYLCVHDGRAAIEWYTRHLGARQVGEIFSMDGAPFTDASKVGHAELWFGDSVVYLSDEWPEGGVLSPRTLGGPGFALMLDVPTVADVDTVYAHALADGATELREPADQFHGSRSGTLVDPFGHRWTITSSLTPRHTSGERFAATELWNEVGYWVLGVADAHKARRFYTALLGWELPEPHDQGEWGLGMHNDSTKIPMGFHSNTEGRNPRLYIRVRDLTAMVERVRELGGEVISVDQHASGGNAVIRDDQGTEFDLWQPAEGY